MSKSISKQRWLEIKTLFDRVLEQPTAQQLDYLDKHCSVGTQLYQDIRHLLTAEDNASIAFGSRAQALTTSLLAVREKALQHNSHKQLSEGSLVGSYRLCEVLGQGGMGIVYRAERYIGDFEQEVAIKLLWHHNHDPKLLDRFEQERQVLAQLSHPNITQLHDGGITNQGIPYLIMEYIKGVPIDLYCDQQDLSVNDCLRLMTQVIDALAFAHKNLIVHRDIKHSNILVNEYGQVKIVDFGIAKILDESISKKLTRTYDQVMTPSFAAPEQLKNQPITIATDIYQLGLVLYQLLTGKQAHDRESLSVLSFIKAVCEETPSKPSAAALNVKSIHNDTIAKNTIIRGLKSRQLHKKLQGDLDSIILKMLEKDSTQRYLTMQAVNQDIENYFTKKPVSAKQSDVLYQTSKFFKRNWRILSVVTTFISLLLLYAVDTTLKAEKIKKALEKIQLEQLKSQQVSNILLEIFKSADPKVVGLNEVTAKDLLQYGEQLVQQKLQSAPAIKADMLTMLGEVYFNYGDYKTSSKMLISARNIQETGNITDQTSIAYTLTNLAHVYLVQDEFNESEKLYKDSLAIQKKLPLDNDNTLLTYANTMLGYGRLLRIKTKYQSSLYYIKQSIDIAKKISNNKEILSHAYNNAAVAHYHLSEFDEAKIYLKKALFVMNSINKKNSSYTIYLVNHAALLLMMEDYQTAEKLINTAWDMQQTMLSPNHIYITNTLRYMGILAHRMGDLDKAENYFRQEISIHKNNNYNNRDLGLAYMLIGTVLQDKTQYSEAQISYQNMINIYSQQSDDELLGRGLQHIASLSYVQGHLLKAQEQYKKAYQLMPNHSFRKTYVQVGYAQVLLSSNTLKRAEELLSSALKFREQRLPPYHSNILEIKALLGIIYSRTNRIEKAQKFLNTVVPIMDKQIYYNSAQYRAIYHDAKQTLENL